MTLLVFFRNQNIPIWLWNLCIQNSPIISPTICREENHWHMIWLLLTSLASLLTSPSCFRLHSNLRVSHTDLLFRMPWSLSAPEASMPVWFPLPNGFFLLTHLIISHSPFCCQFASSVKAPLIPQMDLARSFYFPTALRSLSLVSVTI